MTRADGQSLSSDERCQETGAVGLAMPSNGHCWMKKLEGGIRAERRWDGGGNSKRLGVGTLGRG